MSEESYKPLGHEVRPPHTTDSEPTPTSTEGDYTLADNEEIYPPADGDVVYDPADNEEIYVPDEGEDVDYAEVVEIEEDENEDSGLLTGEYTSDPTPEVTTVIVKADERPPELKEIATKRGVQTFVVGLVASAAFAALNAIAGLIWQLDNWESLWTLLKLAGASAIAAVLQYVYRLKYDTSGFNPDGTPVIYVEDAQPQFGGFDANTSTGADVTPHIHKKNDTPTLG